MSNLPSGTVTFLFTDIEGSTRLAQQYPDRLPALLDKHNEILSQAIEANNGFIFKTVGDGFCVAFHNASDAWQAALEAQGKLHTERWSPAPVKVRMGIYTGPARLEEGTDEASYSGYVTLAMAQRVMSAGHGGQILLSQSAFDLAKNDFPKNIIWKDMGEHHLKDVLHPEHLYQVTTKDLPSEFPALKTLKAHNHNLPIHLTSFIGRERELEETIDRLKGARLLSLIGPGGTGKTRLSIKIGTEVLPAFKDGAWLVELAPLADSALIMQTVASVFGLREGSGRPLADLVIDFLRGKQLLLILDNCEHLIDACARLADSFLRSCPELKILASSREALGINGEAVYRVPSLSLPEQGGGSREALLGCESVQLFVDRATVANPNFQLTDGNASSVAQICHRLDGIPLALELAAARVRILSVEQIAERLDDRFRLLTGGSRTALPRQQTLQALIDWSYHLLTGPEQVVFRRLAVFVGGWTIEAAESVCAGDGVEPYEVLDLLTQLVDKSLMITEERDAAVRFYRLETIRQYARQKLMETEEALKVRNQHLEYFIQLSNWADENWFGPQQQEVEQKLRSEHDNYRAALAWAMESQPEKVLQVISWVVFIGLWLYQGYIAEARDWTQKAVDKIAKLPPVAGDAATLRKQLLSRGWDLIAGVTMNQGDHQTSRVAAEKSVAYAREAADNKLLAQALASLGIGQLYSGEPEMAFASAQESLAICKRLGLKKEYMWAMNTMIHIHNIKGEKAQVQRYKDKMQTLQRQAGIPIDAANAEMERSKQAFGRGDKAEALKHAEAAFKIFEEKKDKYNLTIFQSEVAHYLREQGDLREALSYYRKSILLWQDFGHRAAVAHQLECFAFIAVKLGQLPRAVKLFGAAATLREVSSSVRTPVEQKEFEAAKSDLQSKMESALFTHNWETGRELSMEQAIEHALEEE